MVASKGDVSLKADQVTLGNSAVVATGTDENGAQSNTGNLTVDTNQLNAGNGQLAAGNILTVNATMIDLDRAVDDNTDILRSLGGIALNSNRVSAQNARITALGTLDVKSASSLNLAGGIYSAAGNLLIEGNDVTTNAKLNSQGLATLRSNGGGVTNSGQVAGDNGASVNAATILRNEGDLFSAKAVNITSIGAAINTATGRIAGDEGVTFNVASLNNAGKIAAQGSKLHR